MKSAFGVVSILISFFFAGILWTSTTLAQKRSVLVQLHSFDDSLITLPNDFIIPASIRLTIDSQIILVQGKDYMIDSTFHILTLSLQVRKTFFSIPSGENRTVPVRMLEINYAVLPLNLHKIYSRYQIQVDSTAKTNRTDTVINTSQANNTSNERTMNLTKSGGITRGIQAGSTQDLTFTNSFNLTFSGDLGEDLSFKGALSEESTPLQPDGNTQTLRDIDRIYIETIKKIFFLTNEITHTYTIFST